MSKEQEIALQKLDRLGLLSRKNYLHFQIDRIEDFLKQKEGVS